MARLTITLTMDEKTALESYAFEHRRDPRDQAAIELQQILKLAGYLPVDSHALSPQPARAGYMNNEVRT